MLSKAPSKKESSSVFMSSGEEGLTYQLILAYRNSNPASMVLGGEILKEKKMLQNVPEVVLDSCYGDKFIVAKVTNDRGEEKIVFRAKSKCRGHREILVLLQQELLLIHLRAECVGGGLVAMIPKKKVIFVFDDSGEFGREPNRNQTTITLLQKAFPDFQVFSREPDVDELF